MNGDDDAQRPYPDPDREERPLITLDLAPSEWTVEDLDKLPNDGYRYELHEGALVIMSPAILWHNRVARRLTNLLETGGMLAETQVGIRFGDRSTRIADVVVFNTPVGDDAAYFDPGLIEIAVEIVSPESKERDVGFKPGKYAAAGIPGYWLVERPEDDPSDAFVLVHRLGNGPDGPIYMVIRRYRLSELQKLTADEIKDELSVR